MLAAMPKAPSYVNPTKNKDRAKARRDWVIQRMLEEDFITQAEAEESIKSEIKIMPRRETEFASGADFYAEAIRLNLVERFGEKMFTHKAILLEPIWMKRCSALLLIIYEKHCLNMIDRTDIEAQ